MQVWVERPQRKQNQQETDRVAQLRQNVLKTLQIQVDPTTNEERFVAQNDGLQSLNEIQEILNRDLSEQSFNFDDLEEYTPNVPYEMARAEEGAGRDLNFTRQQRQF